MSRRSRTIKPAPLTDEERVEYAKELKALKRSRPRTRDDCRNGERPCPYVGCRYHLYLDVNPSSGNICFNFPDLEVWELEDTCALDKAEKRGMTLEEVGENLNLTRERIRQVELILFAKMRRSGIFSPEDAKGLGDQGEPYDTYAPGGGMHSIRMEANAPIATFSRWQGLPPPSGKEDD